MLNTILLSALLMGGSPVYPSCESVEQTLVNIGAAMEFMAAEYREKDCRGKDPECFGEIAAFFGLRDLQQNLEAYVKEECRDL